MKKLQGLEQMQETKEQISDMGFGNENKAQALSVLRFYMS